MARISSGASFAYPPSWRRYRSDRGTATAVLRGARGYLGYLNLTPRQGEETQSNWTSFRVEHNAEEGDQAIKRLAAGKSLPFIDGHGSCVMDSYRTKVGAHYIEIACLVAGAHADSVIVGAAPPSSWPQASPAIKRAIEGVRT